MTGKRKIIRKKKVLKRKSQDDAWTKAMDEYQYHGGSAWSSLVSYDVIEDDFTVLLDKVNDISPTDDAWWPEELSNMVDELVDLVEQARETFCKFEKVLDRKVPSAKLGDYLYRVEYCRPAKRYFLGEVVELRRDGAAGTLSYVVETPDGLKRDVSVLATDLEVVTRDEVNKALESRSAIEDAIAMARREKGGSEEESVQS